ncbi:MAG: phosphoribosylglycinamide formyltransferase, partial [Deltaproteobacteria bacterium]|nr:phosphoribosylglycinamide formyltransferase [Deltaproteobacteria bacterium]
RITGATIHLVDPGTDTGPILAQAGVPVLEDDDADTLAARILEMEHKLYPMVLRWAAEGRISVVDGRARVDLPPGESRALFSPAARL